MGKTESNFEPWNQAKEERQKPGGNYVLSPTFEPHRRGIRLPTLRNLPYLLPHTSISTLPTVLSFALVDVFICEQKEGTSGLSWKQRTACFVLIHFG